MPSPSTPRHFLDLRDHPAALLRALLTDAAALKAGLAAGERLRGRAIALMFEKPSTRTRVSFERAARMLGADAIVLLGAEMQRGRGETIADTARVLSRYVDAIMLRTADHTALRALAANASVPVINGLTQSSHPCQVLADVMTLEEVHGPAAGQLVAWCGDGNNVACSWIEAAALFGFTLRLATPAAMRPRPEVLQWARAAGAAVHLTEDPVAAVAGAGCVVTDTWLSMGDAADRTPHEILAPFQVNEALMAHAAPHAVFMHCLPAHRGEEVTEGVIDGPRSVVFEEAENRLHVQKSILSWALGALDATGHPP